MPEQHSHALVIGFLEEQRRERLFLKYPPADIVGGRCISCGKKVYVNLFGAQAIRDRDADVCCPICESLYEADISRAMIES